MPSALDFEMSEVIYHDGLMIQVLWTRSARYDSRQSLTAHGSKPTTLHGENGCYILCRS